MEHPSDIHMISTNDVIDEVVASVSHLMCISEPLGSYLLTVLRMTFKVRKR